jgi:ABC-2 type transport system ATP-binding protein
MVDPIVRVTNLSKYFATRRTLGRILLAPTKLNLKPVLRDINLDVRRGEVLGLVGANGAGKTTLIRILSTLLEPTAGRVEIDGLDLGSNVKEIRRLVGWSLDNERSFYYRLSGRENLSFFAALNEVNFRLTSSRVNDVLALVGLEEIADRPFSTYSWGMRQRLGLARAMLIDPRILLLDEPTKGLDPQAAQDFRVFLRNVLARELKKTLIIVTHHFDEVESCCDRVAVMKNGSISCLGAWETVNEYIQLNGLK